MNASEFKRQILEQSDATGIRKRLVSGEAGINSDDIIDMGTALEQTTKTKGWFYIEAYILKNSNLVSMLFGPDDPVKKGEARALVSLMQYVNQTILAKNDILAKLNEGKE